MELEGEQRWTAWYRVFADTLYSMDPEVTPEVHRTILLRNLERNVGE